MALCSYEQAATGLELERQRRLDAEARLSHLELLVQQLATHPINAETGPTRPVSISSKQNEDDSGVAGEIHLSVSGGAGPSHGLIYNGSTHWSAMLDEIQAIRSTIFVDTSVAEYEVNEPQDAPGMRIIFGATTAVSPTLSDVLAQYLPSREETDRLTSAFFRAKAVASPFIHRSQFRRLYHVFWNDPGAAPPLWCSMLFSILFISTNALTRSNERETIKPRFSIAAAHCLAIGEYFRPKRFAVESLLLYAQSQCLTTVELTPDIGTVLGLLVRLATTMGYHRDPEMFKLSPFEREMRRRTWSLCMQLDLLISFHLGLPSGVQYPTWDTLAPRNLLDSDFKEDTMQLPPERPESEMTDIFFYIAKHRLMTVFEKILRHVLTMGFREIDGPDAEAKVESLDRELRSVYSSFPEILSPRPMSASFVDSPALIVTRLCVSFLYQNCLCVLHRPYVARHRLQSILVCYTEASNLLRDFLDAYQETLPGGQMETEHWFMSSLTWHQFLSSAAALCAVLCAASQGSGSAEIDVSATLALLGRARAVRTKQAVQSNKDTIKIMSLIETTIRRFGTSPHEGNSNTMIDNGPASDTVQDNFFYMQDEWAWNEFTTELVSDSTWTYFEQFLDLPGDNSMADS